MWIHFESWHRSWLCFSYLLSYILVLKSDMCIRQQYCSLTTKYVIKAWQSSYVRNEGMYGLTLLHRSYPIPFLRNSERDLAVVPEVQKRNNNSLRGALFWGSGAQQLACQTCIFMKIQCNDLWYRRNLNIENGILPQKGIFFSWKYYADLWLS